MAEEGLDLEKAGGDLCVNYETGIHVCLTEQCLRPPRNIKELKKQSKNDKRVSCLQIQNSECVVKRGPEKDNIIERSEILTYDFAMTPTEALIM
ncbi:hypothetical protein Y1Q_0018969 [Alligator mississippiensis]|uniref:Uncharacterized protein n=1 Tax=Alligator mississippiensis TaxID=8496 RepID=A0A151M3E7_ALLMI|nr:hypothetical protein Y1Q_0018969 [Alligator mississippiensis]